MTISGANEIMGQGAKYADVLFIRLVGSVYDYFGSQ